MIVTSNSSLRRESITQIGAESVEVTITNFQNFLALVSAHALGVALVFNFTADAST